MIRWFLIAVLAGAATDIEASTRYASPEHDAAREARHKLLAELG